MRDEERRKKERDGLMQRMSRGRDQWQLNSHRLDSLNKVATRNNGQESLQARTRSSTRANIEISFFSVLSSFFFLRDFILLKEIQIGKDNFVLHVTYFQHFAQTWVQTKERKTMKDFFTSNGRKFSKQVLGGINQVVFLKKKSRLIYLVRTNTIEKNKKKKAKHQWRQNKNSFTQSDEQMKKRYFLSKKRKHKERKHGKRKKKSKEKRGEKEEYQEGEKT